MDNERAITTLKARSEFVADINLDAQVAYNLAIKALEKQVAMPVTIKHEVGDEVALIVCPSCERSIIADLTKYSEFNKDWYCKDCGQHLTLEDDESEDFDFDVLGQPNCCDCEWTYNGGECDNCEWE